MFSKLISKFIKIAYASIIKDGTHCDVSLKVFKNGVLVESDIKHFSLETRESAKLLYEFFLHLADKYQIIYTATVINSINQGGVPVCNKSDFGRFEVDATNAIVVCIGDKWSVFASKYDIENTKKELEELGGVDFIFSSITAMRIFFEDLIGDFSPALCILKQKTSATIAIFSKEKLLFSSYAIIQSETKEEDTGTGDSDGIFSDESESEEKLVDLDDIALELGEVEEITQTQDGESGNIESERGLDSLGSDIKTLEFVKNALNDFYKKGVYEASFIDKIYIADPYGDCEEIRTLLENELMLDVELVDFPLSEIVVDMAINEVQKK